MSNIPYTFDTPVPRYFRETGWFENENAWKFITWAFARCTPYARKKVMDNEELLLEPFEFICGRIKNSDECFLTEKQFRKQRDSLVDSGYIKKGANSRANRFNTYIWATERFSDIEGQQKGQLRANQGPTKGHKTEVKGKTVERDVTCVGPSAEAAVEGKVYECLKTLDISANDKANLSKDFSEIDLIRAIHVMRESKKPIATTVGYLKTAIAKKWKPKQTPFENPIKLPEDAEKKRKSFLKARKELDEKIKIKDIEVKDMFDHIVFCGKIIFYEDEKFHQKASDLFHQHNLLQTINGKTMATR